MASLPAIPLDDNWLYRYFPRDASAYGIFDGAAGAIPSLLDWGGQEFPDMVVWLHRTFILKPTELCVRYFLHIEGAPQVAAISINEHNIYGVPQGESIVVDVTDYVALEENTIAIRIVQGTIGRVWLQAVPCEDCPE